MQTFSPNCKAPVLEHSDGALHHLCIEERKQPFLISVMGHRLATTLRRLPWLLGPHSYDLVEDLELDEAYANVDSLVEP